LRRTVGGRSWAIPPTHLPYARMKACARHPDMKNISHDDKFALLDVCERLPGQGFRRYG
jgi:hypothetical protein